MHKKFILLLTIIFFLLNNSVTAQTFNIKTYTAADGFKGSSIQTLFTDSYGYLWISTYADLFRFDGNSFKKFGSEDGLQGSLNVIGFEDSHHKLWGTSGNGSSNTVICFDNGRFTTFNFDKRDSVGYIFSFYETRDKILYACTDHGVFGLINDHFKKIDLGLRPEMLYVRSMLNGKDNSVFICTPLYVLQKTTDKKIKIIADTSVAKVFYNLIVAGNKIAIVGDGVFLYDFHSLKKISKDFFNNDYIIAAMTDDKGGVYACGIDSGLVYLNNDSVQHIYANENVNMGFVSSIAEDREKNIWIGLLRLYRLNANYVNHFTKANGMEGTDTRSVFFARSGTGYLGQTSFTIYDGKKFIPASALLNKNDIAKFTDHIPYFLQDDDKGRIWMMLNPNKIFRYNNHKLEDLNSKFNPQHQRMGQIKFDPVDSSIYIALDSIVHIKNDSIVEKIALQKGNYSGKPLSLCFDHEHRLWIGTTGGNFGFINLHSKKFYATAANAKQSSQKIICANDGTIWMANTGYGIYHYTVTSGNKIILLSHITEQNDLPSNSVWDIVFDNQDFLWASTSDGLIRYKMSVIKGKDSIVSSHVFDMNDGLNPRSFVDSHLALDPSGNVWLTTYDGVYRINPKDVPYNSLAPLVHIERVMVFNDSSNGNNYAKSSVTYFNIPLNPVLPFDKNSITIYFNSVAFMHLDEIECQYKLEGLNDNWITSNPTSNASYINLPAGRYIFHVRARRKNYAWSEEATFAFTIQPPYWQSWWFSLIVIVIASSILIIAFRLRLNQLNRKASIQHQIQDLEMQALKARMNPHFIYNAMNSIQSLIVSNEQEKAVRYLGKFAKLLRQVLDNSNQQLITLEKELSSVQLYIELESLRLHLDFDYKINIEEGLNADDEFVPPLTLQPFIENALWHGLSNKQGSKKLNINISIQDEYLVAEIIDNGIGRKKSAEIKSKNVAVNISKGLSITERRLALLNNDNTTPVVIEDLLDENENAAGTKVIVRMKKNTST